MLDNYVTKKSRLFYPYKNKKSNEIFHRTLGKRFLFFFKTVGCTTFSLQFNSTFAVVVIDVKRD